MKFEEWVEIQAQQLWTGVGTGADWSQLTEFAKDLIRAKVKGIVRSYQEWQR